jgi:hypothetical protein
MYPKQIVTIFSGVQTDSLSAMDVNGRYSKDPILVDVQRPANVSSFRQFRAAEL